MPYATTLEEKFWKWVTVPMDDEECWLWTASVTDNGYPQVMHEGKNYKVHRVSYELHFESIPEDMTIDHICENKRCVNPLHLDVVTQQENVIRSLDSRTIS